FVLGAVPAGPILHAFTAAPAFHAPGGDPAGRRRRGRGGAEEHGGERGRERDEDEGDATTGGGRVGGHRSPPAPVGPGSQPEVPPDLFFAPEGTFLSGGGRTARGPPGRPDGRALS